MEPDWIPRYLDWLGSQRVSQSTRALYDHQLRAFLRWLSGRGLELKSVGPPAVRDYLRDLRTAGYRDVSALGVLKSLQRFSAFALEAGLVSKDPTRDICTSCLELRGRYPPRQGVLRDIFRKPGASIKYRLRIYGPPWERYVRQMRELGYSHVHIVHTLIANFHFHQFLAKQGVRRLAQITPERLESFLRVRGGASKNNDRALSSNFWDHAGSYIKPFLAYALGRKFEERSPSYESRALPQRLLDRYLHFSTSHQGHKSTTQSVRCLWLKKLGIFLDQQRVRNIREIAVRHLDNFLIEQADHVAPRSLHVVTSSLRSFLRFLFLRGTISTDLARQVASPVRFSHDLRPKFLPWTKVQGLLAAIDRETVVGKRDYAMVALMAYHGLRSHEVAALRVSDIDFDGASMALVRKGGVRQRQPLSAQAIEALKDYLAARPASAYPEIFLRESAPRRPLGGSVKNSVIWHMHRHFGDTIPRHGSHLLRHSFAKALLDRGAKLPDIAELLGHRDLASTSVYTRVATEDLREVADNYAQLLTPHEASLP